ncbi:MAG TPA: hypothetical protein VFI90_08185, partial [Rubrobacter sp.]|nr:hypothetical protein [Rubrobacter sp.]
MKAFFTLAAGVTRGEVPDPDALQSTIQAQTRKLAEARRHIERQDQRIEQLQGSISANKSALPEGSGFRVGTGRINPENIVWILGSPRTG